MLTWVRSLDRVIRGELTQPDALRNGTIEQPVGGLALMGVILGALYGVCMGSFSLFQGKSGASLFVVAAFIKTPLLFFLTLAVTFPSLYVFNALVGSRLTLLAVLRLLIVSLTVMLTVLASLGPIVAFFAASTTNYHFMLVLNVVIFSVSGYLGLRYMVVTLQRLSAPLTPETTNVFGETEKPQGALDTNTKIIGQDVRSVFRVWILVFGAVGAQMAWVLRPFIGTPDRAFAWFRLRESNFFEAVFHSLQQLFR